MVEKASDSQYDYEIPEEPKPQQAATAKAQDSQYDYEIPASASAPAKPKTVKAQDAQYDYEIPEGAAAAKAPQGDYFGKPAGYEPKTSSDFTVAVPRFGAADPRDAAPIERAADIRARMAGPSATEQLIGKIRAQQPAAPESNAPPPVMRPDEIAAFQRRKASASPELAAAIAPQPPQPREDRLSVRASDAAARTRDIATSGAAAAGQGYNDLMEQAGAAVDADKTGISDVPVAGAKLLQGALDQLAAARQQYVQKAPQAATGVAQTLGVEDPDMQGAIGGVAKLYATLTSLMADPGMQAGLGAVAKTGKAAPYILRGIEAAFGAQGATQFMEGYQRHRAAISDEEKRAATEQMVEGAGLGFLVAQHPAMELFGRSVADSMSARDVARGINKRAMSGGDAVKRAGLLHDIGLTENASDAEIASAIKRTLRATHPDIPGNTWDALGQERFRRAIEARDEMPPAGEGAVEPVPVPGKSIPQRIVEAAAVLKSSLEVRDWEGAREALRILRESGAEEAPKVGQVSGREPLPQRPVPPGMRLGAANDREDAAGIPSQERVGQEPVQAGPVEGAGGEAPRDGGVVQGAQAGEGQLGRGPVPQAEVSPAQEPVQAEAAGDIKAQTEALLAGARRAIIWHKNGPQPDGIQPPEGIGAVTTPAGAVWYRRDSGLDDETVKQLASTTEGLGKLLEMPEGGRPQEKNPKVITVIDADGNEVWSAEITDKTRSRAMKRAAAMAEKIGGSVTETTRKEVVAGRQERIEQEQKVQKATEKEKGEGFVALYSDTDHGVNFEVHQLKNGKFSVLLRDRDSDRIVSAVRVFPNLDDALAHAKDMRDKSVGRPVPEPKAAPAKAEAPEAPEPGSRDASLRRALTSVEGSEERWEKVRAAAPDDETLTKHIAYEFGTQGGGYAPGTLMYNYWGGKNPRVEIGPHGKAEKLQGKKLLAEVRRVLNIPEPGGESEAERLGREGSRYEGEDLDLIEAQVIKEQKGRLAEIKKLNDEFVKKGKLSEAKQKARKELQETYDATYVELGSAGGDPEAVRAKVEGKARKKAAPKEPAKPDPNREAVAAFLKEKVKDGWDEQLVGLDRAAVEWEKEGSGTKAAFWQKLAEETLPKKEKKPTPSHVALRRTLLPDIRSGRLPDAVIDKVDAINSWEEAKQLLARVQEASAEAKRRVEKKEKGALAEYRDLKALATLIAMRKELFAPFGGRIGAKYTYKNTVDKLRAVNLEEARHRGELEPLEWEGDALAEPGTAYGSADIIETLRRSSHQRGDEDLVAEDGAEYGQPALASPVFFSAVERAIDAMPFKSIPASDLLARLVKTPGVKQEELDWIGLPQWLEGKDRVSKDEVKTFLDENKVEVVPVEKGMFAPGGFWRAEMERDIQAANPYEKGMALVRKIQGAGLVGGNFDIANLRPHDHMSSWQREMLKRVRDAGFGAELDEYNAALDTFNDLRRQRDMANPIDREAYEANAAEEEIGLERIRADREVRDLFEAWPDAARKMFGDRITENHDGALDDVLELTLPVPLHAREAAYFRGVMRQAEEQNVPHAAEFLAAFNKVWEINVRRIDVRNRAIRANLRREESKSNPEYRKFLTIPSHTTPEHYGEFLLTMPSIDYREPHWGGTPGVIAHGRATATRTASGKRTLLWQEFQSQLHQKGREQGYGGDEAAKMEAGARYRAALRSVQESLDELGKHGIETRESGVESGRIFLERFDAKHDYVRRLAAVSDGSVEIQSDTVTPEEEALIDRYAERYVELEAALEAANKIKNGLPNAPFKKSWPLLTFKYLLRRAAEEGYDSITWPTGEQAAEAWSLRKHVSKIVASRRNDGQYAVQAWDKSGQMVFRGANRLVLQPEKLPDYFGKEMAQNIIKDTVPVGDGESSWSGMELKVGGEDRMALYDEVMRNQINSYIKKWGGKVGTDAIPGKESPGGLEEDDLPLYVDETGAVGDEGPEFAIWDREDGHGGPIEEGFANRELALVAMRRILMARGFADPRLGESGPITPPATPVHSVEITPAMREAALAGQALFEPRNRYNDPNQRKLFGEDESERGTGALRKPDENLPLPEPAAQGTAPAAPVQPEAAGGVGFSKRSRRFTEAQLASRNAEAARRGREVMEQLLADMRASVPGGVDPDNDPFVVVASKINKTFRRGDFVSLVGYDVPDAKALGVVAQVAANPAFETLRILLLDDDDVVLQELAFSSHLAAGVGSSHVDATPAAIRTAMQQHGATKWAAVHNHPGGDATPSTEDKEFTIRYATDVPGFIGHVVIDHDTFGFIDKWGKATQFPLTDEARARRPKLFEDPDQSEAFKHLGLRLNGPEDMGAFAASMHTEERSILILFASPLGAHSNGCRIRAIATVPYEKFIDYAWMTRRLRYEQGFFGSQHVMAYTSGKGFSIDEKIKIVSAAQDLYKMPAGGPWTTLTDFLMGSDPRLATNNTMVRRGSPSMGRFAPTPTVRLAEPESEYGKEHPWGTKKVVYFTGASNEPVEKIARERGDVGLLITPNTMSSLLPKAKHYATLAIDNGLFSSTYKFDPEKFRQLIAKVAEDPELKAKVKFVVAPDVPGDMDATLVKSRPWFKEIRDAGLPVALAFQNGAEDYRKQDIPWDEFDVAFIGGSPMVTREGKVEWKTGMWDPAEGLDEDGKVSAPAEDWMKLWRWAAEEGKPVHMGRVNSNERLEHARNMAGAHSVDGTYLSYGPKKNTPNLLAWLKEHNDLVKPGLAARRGPATDEGQIGLFEPAAAYGAAPEEDAKSARQRAFERWFEGSVVTNEDGSPKVMYHGTSALDEFDVFRTEPEQNQRRMTDLGAHFGTREQANDLINAREYLKPDAELIPSDQYNHSPKRVLPVYLSIKNPFRLPDLGSWLSPHNYLNLPGTDTLEREIRQLAEKAIEAGKQEAASMPVYELQYLHNARNEDFAKKLRKLLGDWGYDGIVYVNENEAADEEADSYIAFHPWQIKSALGNSGTFSKEEKSILREDGTEYGLPPMREKGIPPEAPMVALQSQSTTRLQGDPDYKAAKAGDREAAGNLVDRLVDDAALEKARVFGKGAIYVYPHAEEAAGRNAIPGATAGKLAAMLDGTVGDIVQSNRTYHTGANAKQRMISRATFDGPVEKGGRYVLVDDVTTLGGTLAELAHHIQKGGGEVVGTFLLAEKLRGGKLAPERRTVDEIEHRFGDFVRSALGIEPAALTGPEADYLIGHKSADTLATTLSTARRERAERLRAKAVGEGSGEVKEPEAFYGPLPDRPLIAVHNTSENGILAAEKLGGIPVPSIAVLRPGERFEGYGHVTLVGSRDLIDPQRDSRNKVYASDAYSPNQPFPSRKMDRKGIDAFEKEINKINEGSGWPTWWRGSLNSYREDQSQRYIEDLANASPVREAYFRDMGRDLSDLTPIPPRPAAGGDRGAYEAGQHARGDELRTMHEQLEDRDAIDNWVRDLLEKHGALGPEYLQHGRAKKEYTLENIVRAMTSKGIRAQENGLTYGVGAARAANTPLLKSVEAMKKRWEKLIDEQGMEAAKKKFQEEFFALHKAVHYDYHTSSTWDSLDDFSRVLRDVPRMGAASAMRRNGFNPSGLDLAFDDKDESIEDALVRLAGELQALPTEYFEAKPERGVKLSEFLGAVVPVNTPQKYIDSLRRQGITDIRTYDRGDEEKGDYPTRREAVQSFTNAVFEEPVEYGKPEKKKSALDYAERFAPGAARALRPRGPEDEVRLAASDPTAGIFSEIFASRAPKASKTSQLPNPLDSHDPEVERRLREAEGLVSPGILARVRQAFTDLEHSFTRHFVDLDTKESPTLALDADILRQLESSQDTAKAIALDTIAYIADGLDKPAMRLFTRILALRDLHRSIDEGLYEDKDELPFGYEDKAAVTYDLRKYEALAKSDPAVEKALEKRERYAHELTQKLVDLELLPEDVLEDPRYYHRQVMAIFNQKDAAYVGTGSQDVRVHKKGFQKARSGGGDFNMRYQEAEFEWMAQGHSLIAMREALDRLKEANDIAPGLKQQAKMANLYAVYGGVENYREVQRLKAEKAAIYQQGDIVLDKEDKKRIAAINAQLEDLDPLKPYSDRIGWNIHDLGKMAEHDELNHAPANLQEAVDELRQSSEWEEFRGDDESELFFPLLNYLAGSGKAGSMQAAGIFKAIAERNKFIKDELGNEFKTWRDLIPDTHPKAPKSRAVVWQPEKGSIFYRAATLPDRALERILETLKEAPEDVIDKEALEELLGKAREALVMGGPKEEWVIPEGLAKTLDNWRGGGRERGLEELHGKLLQSWKQWVLLNPVRALRYNLNNESGDLDIVLAAYPGALRGWGQAARDLWKYHVKEDRSDEKLVKELQDAMKLGVLSSGQSVMEIPDINDAGFFKDFTDDNPNVVQKALQKYWEGTKKFSTWRENTLRLAVYRFLLGEAAKGKKLYGASKRWEIDAITNPKERAAKISRELIGDYGNISAAGKWIRQHMIPFYSWMEINAPRYYRLLINAAYEDRGGGGGEGGEGGEGGKGGGGGTGRRAARMAGVAAKKAAVSYAKLALFAPLLYAVVQASNHILFPDEDRILSSSGNKKNQRLILGHNADGSIRSIRFQGALSDALEWFGLGNVVSDVREMAEGRATLKNKLADAATSPIEKIAGAWEPFSKSVFELLFGYRAYPSLFKEGTLELAPHKIRDRAEYLADVAWPAGALYRKVTGRPMRPSPDMGIPGFGPLLDVLLVQRTDPGEAAYWYARDLANRFNEAQGKPAATGGPTGEAADRSNALYYFKRACEWGDEKAAEKWLAEYYELGGTPGKMREAFVREHPMGGISLGKRGAFLQTLSDRDRAIVQNAVNWYQEGRQRANRVASETPFTPAPRRATAP